MSRSPPEDRGMITRLGTLSPAEKLIFDASGRTVPSGKAVRKLVAVPPVPVTLATTALAPEGTPPSPVTCTSSVPPAERVFPAQGVEFPLLLVSQIREGVSELKPRPDPGP